MSTATITADSAAFESARLGAANAKAELTKAQQLVEYLDGIRGKHEAEKPSISEVLPDNGRVVAWKQEAEEIKKLYADAVADRNLKASLLQSAEKTQATAKVQAAQCQLAAVHAELDELEPCLAQLVADHNRWKGCRDALQSQISALTAQLEQGRPVGFDFMAEHDPRRQRWERESKPLLSERQKLITERGNLKGVDTLEIAKIRDQIKHLKEFAIPNLQSVIRGRTEGGVFRVTEGGLFGVGV